MREEENGGETLFQEDVLLSSQYFDTIRSLDLKPDRKLMLTMLDDSVGCFRKYALSKKKKENELFGQAQAWILDDRSDWIFSFVNVCDALDVDPQYLRGGLLRWKERVAEQHKNDEGDCPASDATAQMSSGGDDPVPLELTSWGEEEEEPEGLGMKPSEEGEEVRDEGPLTPLNLYLKEVASVPLLSREQEVELGRKQEEAKAKHFAEIFSIPCSWRPVLEIGERVEKGELSIADAVVEVVPGEEERKKHTFLEQMARLRQLTRVAAERIDAPRPSSSRRTDILETVESLELSESSLGEIARDVKDALVRLANLQESDPAGAETQTLEKEVGLSGAEAQDRVRAITEAEDSITSARRELATANLRLVLWVARRHAHREIPLLDIIQLGNMGLMRAAEKFDYRRGYRFSTYAVPWIRQSIARGIVDTVPTIRIPARLAEARNKILRTHARLRQELGREPHVDEIAADVGSPVSEVRAAMSAVGEPVSLHMPIGEQEDASLIDFVEDRYGPQPLERAVEDDLYAKVQEALGTLPEREEKIVRLRFGIGNDRDHTLEEVGEVFSVSRERIRQLEQIAVRKLRFPVEERRA